MHNSERQKRKLTTKKKCECTCGAHDGEPTASRNFREPVVRKKRSVAAARRSAEFCYRVGHCYRLRRHARRGSARSAGDYIVHCNDSLRDAPDDLAPWHVARCRRWVLQTAQSVSFGIACRRDLFVAPRHPPESQRRLTSAAASDTASRAHPRRHFRAVFH